MSLQEPIREAVDALTISIKSIVEADELGAADVAALIGKSFGQFKEHIKKLVPAGLEKAAAKKDDDKMNQVVNFTKQHPTNPPDPKTALEIIKLAKSINAGTSANHASKASWYEVMKRLAEQDRKSGQSSEQAFAAFIQTPDGAELFKAYKSASGPDFAAPAAPVQVIKTDSAYARLRKIADGIIVEQPQLTREQAFARAFSDPANRALAEESKRESAFA
jgi:hypothetical protein